MDLAVAGADTIAPPVHTIKCGAVVDLKSVNNVAFPADVMVAITSVCSAHKHGKETLLTLVQVYTCITYHTLCVGVWKVHYIQQKQHSTSKNQQT